MTGTAAALPKYQFYDAVGAPLANGTITTYLAGTTTLSSTWQDSDLTTLNTNPVVLDSHGECMIWLDSTKVYKVVLKNSAGVTQWSQDNIVGSAENPSITLTTAVLATYQGAASSNPATRTGGTALQNGDLYFNTSTNRMLAFANGVWYATESVGATVADLVTYTPAGTGAVPSTVQAKLRENVSVKDFGAVGDGVTDDTAAIRAAIAHIKSVGGGVVVFPFGTYKVSSTVSIAGYFGLGGIKVIGNNSKIVSTNNSPAFLIDAYNGGGGASADEYRIKAHIDGLYFYGPGKASTSSVGIAIQYSAAVRVTDCVIRNYYVGLQGAGVLLSAFEELQINNNAVGISFNFSTLPIGFGCNDNHFSRCLIVKNDKAMFYSTGGGADTSFSGCEFESNNQGSVSPTDGVKVIELYLCGKITFNSCYFESNHGQYNIIYSGQDATGSLNLFGCQFLLDGNTGYGIYLDNTFGVANSLTLIGSSIGTCTTSDLYIGTGFSATVINSPVNNITGALKNLQRIQDGKYMSGSATSTYAQMLLNGSANSNNIGLDVNGLLRFTDANGSTRYSYLIGNATATSLLIDSGYVQLGLNSGAPRVLIGRLGTATVEPYTDNTHSLGTASYRWSVVYAGTGTINTSDERNKQDIASLDDAELRVATALKRLVKKYRFKDAVAEKGDGARIHVGVIAQEVMAAFDAEGLDAMRYAVVCYDEWDSEAEELAADGTVTRPAREAGNRYGIRYEELLAFMIAAL